MNIKELIEEIRFLRDETNHPSCNEHSSEYTTDCICARFDRVIDVLQEMRLEKITKAAMDLLKMGEE